MMKPNVEKILRDVQSLSKRMRSREDVADDLLGKLGMVQSQLDAMRLFQEESLEYESIAQRAEKGPRKQLILCLAAENKQLEQLKMQNKTLESSLEEHQLTLEMIMSKYREQVSSLMRTSETEIKVDMSQTATVPSDAAVDWMDSRPPQKPSISAKERALMEERLAVMAAIAQEVAEQSDTYSTELETELYRLQTENASLRELLSIGGGGGGGQQMNRSSTSNRRLGALEHEVASPSAGRNITVQKFVERKDVEPMEDEEEVEEQQRVNHAPADEEGAESDNTIEGS